MNVIIIIPLCLSAQSRGATKGTANFVCTGKLLAIKETYKYGPKVVRCSQSSHQHCDNKSQVTSHEENEMVPASSYAALAVDDGAQQGLNSVYCYRKAVVASQMVTVAKHEWGKKIEEAVCTLIRIYSSEKVVCKSEMATLWITDHEILPTGP